MINNRIVKKIVPRIKFIKISIKYYFYSSRLLGEQKTSSLEIYIIRNISIIDNWGFFILVNILNFIKFKMRQKII